MERLNLIQNPSFEANISDFWDEYTTSGTPAMTRDATVFQVGSSSFKMDAGGVNADAGLTVHLVLPPGLYFLSAYVKTEGLTGDAKVVMRNTNDFAPDINLTITAANQPFTRVSGSFLVTVTTPFDILLSMGSYGTPAQGKVWWDAVLLEQAQALGDYFDGATPDTSLFDYLWNGTANNSVSIARRTARRSAAPGRVPVSGRVAATGRVPVSGRVSILQ